MRPQADEVVVRGSETDAGLMDGLGELSGLG